MFLMPAIAFCGVRGGARGCHRAAIAQRPSFRRSRRYAARSSREDHERIAAGVAGAEEVEVDAILLPIVILSL